MDAVLTNITEYMLKQSCQVAILFALVAIVCLALKKKTAHLRYLLWLLILAKCLVPSVVTISLAILPQGPEPAQAAAPIEQPAAMPLTTGTITPMEYTPIVPVVTPLPPQPSIIERLTQAMAQLSAKTYFALAWLAGLIVFSMAVIIKAVKVNIRFTRARRRVGGNGKTWIDSFFAEFAPHSAPNVYLLEGTGQPFVWGLVKGSIYLPANFAKIGSGDHRRKILAHELAHITRFDALVNALQVVAQGIFWFHPLVWLANRNIRAEREKCCDETAIAKLSATPTDYSSAIVDTLVAEYKSTLPVPSLAIAGPIKNIEDRIKTIMKPGKKFQKRPTIIAILIIVVMAAVIVPTTIALTRRPAKTDVQIEVEKPTVQVEENTFQSSGLNKTSENEDYSDPAVAAIIQKVLNRYASLKTYSDVGEVLTDMDMSGIDMANVPGMPPKKLQELQENKEFQQVLKKRQKFKHTFTMKLARPNSYCIEWTQKVHVAFTNTGAVWSAGDGHFLLNAGRKTSPKDRQMALASATGVSGGAANTIPLLFFDSSTSVLGQLQEARLEGEEPIEGDVCCVIAGKMLGATMKFWVSKETLLVRQRQQILGGKFEIPELSEENIKKALVTAGVEVTDEAVQRFREQIKSSRKMSSQTKGSITETHRNIVIDQPIEPKRFIPAEAVKNEIEKSFSPKEKSFNNLKTLGLATIMYANDHEGQFPDSLKQLSPYLEMKIRRWIAAGNVEYVGKGKTSSGNPQTVMAYDKMLLDNNATNVLFLDGHVEFCRRKRLETLGIAPAYETADDAFRAFITASVKADSEGLKSMVHPGSRALQQISDLKQRHDLENVSIVRTSFLPNGTFVVTTSHVTDDRGRAGQLAFTMVNANHLVSPKHKWLVTSIDFIPDTAVDLDEDTQIKNVSLKPNLKTNVQIEVEKSAVDVAVVNLPVRFIASDNDGKVERYHWRLNLTRPVRLSLHSFRIEGDSIRGYWGSTDGTLTSPENGTNIDYQLIISKGGDELDYLMRKSQSHEGLNGYDDAASSSRKQIAQPECDQIRTYILKEPVGLSEKYLPLWKRDFIKDGSVITLMYAVRIAGYTTINYDEKEDNPFVPTINDIADNTSDMVEVAKTAVEVEVGKTDQANKTTDKQEKAQVSIEARFMVVDENFLEDVGFNFKILDSDEPPKATVYIGTPTEGETTEEAFKMDGIDDLQIDLLIRAAQAHANSKVLTAPKVTVLDGEQAEISVTKEIKYVTSYTESNDPSQPPEPNTDTFIEGIQFKVLPRITDDNKHILLKIAFERSEILSSLKQMYKDKYPYELPTIEKITMDAQASVADKGTILLGGLTLTAEREIDAGVPILSKIPIINRLFSNRSKVKDRQILLVLVKPTIVPRREPKPDAIAVME